MVTNFYFPAPSRSQSSTGLHANTSRRRRRGRLGSTSRPKQNRGRRIFSDTKTQQQKVAAQTEESQFDLFKGVSIERFIATNSPVQSQSSPRSNAKTKKQPLSPSRRVIQRFFASSKSHDEDEVSDDDDSIGLGQKFFDPFLEYWGLKQSDAKRNDVQSPTEPKEQILSIRPSRSQLNISTNDPTNGHIIDETDCPSPTLVKDPGQLSKLHSNDTIPERLPKMMLDPVNYETSKRTGGIKSLVCRKYKPEMRSTVALEQESRQPSDEATATRRQLPRSSSSRSQAHLSVSSRQQLSGMSQKQAPLKAPPPVTVIPLRKQPVPQYENKISLPANPRTAETASLDSATSRAQPHPVPVIRNAFVGGNLPHQLPKRQPSPPRSRQPLSRSAPSTQSAGDLSLRVTSGFNFFTSNSTGRESPLSVNVTEGYPMFEHHTAAAEEIRSPAAEEEREEIPQKQGSWFQPYLFKGDQSQGSNSSSTESDSGDASDDESEYSEFSMDMTGMVPSISAASNGLDRYYIEDYCFSGEEDDILSIQGSESYTAHEGESRAGLVSSRSVGGMARNTASTRGTNEWRSKRATYGPPQPNQIPNARIGYRFARSSSKGSMAVVSESGRPVLRYSSFKRK